MRLLRRRTARLRLTALYGLLFLLTGAGLLLIVGLLTVRSTSAARAVPARQLVWHTLLVGSVVALGIMAVVSVLLGWFVANRVLRPLRTMTAATRRISADNRAGRQVRRNQRQRPDRTPRQRPGRRLGAGQPGADLPHGRQRAGQRGNPQR
jgi:uncharacterized oligopeptide transporter (OPT) family protein